jgi:hypothetical protein
MHVLMQYTFPTIKSANTILILNFGKDAKQNLLEQRADESE